MNVPNWPVGAPNSAARAEYDSWRELCARLLALSDETAAIQRCAAHSPSDGCAEEGCKIFRAVRAWGEALVTFRAHALRRKVLEEAALAIEATHGLGSVYSIAVAETVRKL